MTVESTSAEMDPQRNPLWFDRRERRRTRTRLTVQSAALRLFAEKGYANTTVEEIAEAADISPRTFFRYFPTKEDVVIWDEYDPLVLDAIDTRPADESPAETCRAIMRTSIAVLYQHDPERLLARQKLLTAEPELRARAIELLDGGVQRLVSLAAARRHLPPDDPALRVVAAALGGAITVAVDRWASEGGKADPVALFDDVVDALIDGIRTLQPSSRWRGGSLKAALPQQ